MQTDIVISKRSGTLTSAATPLLAAILAADAAGEGAFHPQDVRFYFLLFTNWMGDDHLRPGADLDPTQARRMLGHLAADGLATTAGGRPPTWGLCPGGVVRLVEALTDPRAVRRFEEVLLLASAATLYVDAIAARLSGGDSRRVRQRLDGASILRAERRRLGDALIDMDARRDAGVELAAEAEAGLAAGLTAEGVAQRLTGRRMPYQLHPMRPLPEAIAGLPPSLRDREIGRGASLRSAWLFAPLADDLRARIGILERLERSITRA